MLPGCEVIVHRCHATLVLRCVYIYNNDCCECCCAGVVMFCPFECFKKNQKKNDIRRGRGLAGGCACNSACLEIVQDVVQCIPDYCCFPVAVCAFFFFLPPAATC